MSPPIKGHPFTIGGTLFLDLGTMKAEMSLATRIVATRRRPVFRNLPSISMIVLCCVCVCVWCEDCEVENDVVMKVDVM